MNPITPLEFEKSHLTGLLAVIQPCVYLLNVSSQDLQWPMRAGYLAELKKDIHLLEEFAGINKLFAKLHFNMGVALRNSLVLSGEQADCHYKLLAIFEKSGVVQYIVTWQVARAAGKLAAHNMKPFTNWLQTISMLYKRSSTC